MQLFQSNLFLVPTDFSEIATGALQYAGSLAARCGARLQVIFADPFLPPPYFSTRQAEDIAAVLEQSKRLAREQLDRYVHEHIAQTVPAEARVVEDYPVRAIMTTADQYNADMIIMGTHGRSGWSRLMLGSVTEKVLRETRRPVLTVRPQSTVAPSSGLTIQRLLCPVNFTDTSARSLEHASALAACLGAELWVLHVIESPSSPPSEEEEVDRLCEWVAPDIRARCRLQETVARGEAAEQILTTASSLGCDMIVMAAQHRRFLNTTVLGTTTVRVNRHAPCPVLTVVSESAS
ncbi:MAG: universal stress protein [Acidobacteriota bacterium]|nr:universal stress protein [Blastocatellia bacterium]MDW8239926.1 universal stress protein [Acidobacteriota bacterium]